MNERQTLPSAQLSPSSAEQEPSLRSSGRALSAVRMAVPRGANAHISLSVTATGGMPLGTGELSVSVNVTAPSTVKIHDSSSDVQRRTSKLKPMLESG